MKATIVLALLCVIAYADQDGHAHAGGHHDHHGSVCLLEPEKLRTVVNCVEEKVDPVVLGKLNGVREQLHCEDIFCGIQKFCEMDGTLENNRTDIFTKEQNEQLREAFHDCRPEHQGA